MTKFLTHFIEGNIHIIENDFTTFIQKACTILSEKTMKELVEVLEPVFPNVHEEVEKVFMNKFQHSFEDIWMQYEDPFSLYLVKFLDKYMITQCGLEYDRIYELVNEYLITNYPEVTLQHRR